MRSLKILLVEDSKDIRTLLAGFLSNLGHKVVEAANGKEGMMIFEKSLDFDLVITDRNMPGGILGEEVVRFIKFSYPQTKVFLMSSDLEREVEMVAKAAGADGVFDKRALIGRMEEVLKNF